MYPILITDYTTMTQKKKEEETFICSFCDKQWTIDKKVGNKHLHLCNICYAAFHIN